MENDFIFQLAKSQNMEHYPIETLISLYNNLLIEAPFMVGDKVVSLKNYEDEQLDRYAPTHTRTVTAVEHTGRLGSSGYWIQVDNEKEWVDSGWFKVENE